MLEKRLEYSERVSQRGHAEESLGNKIKVNNEVNLSDGEVDRVQNGQLFVEFVPEWFLIYYFLLYKMILFKMERDS